MEETKQCKNKECQRVLPLGEFYKHSGCKGGRRPECKSCTDKRNKAYSEAHEDEMRAARQSYYQENRESIRQKQKGYYQDNKEPAKLRSKRQREENRSSYIAYLREYRANHLEEERERSANYRLRNKETLDEKKRQYLKDNPQVRTTIRQNRRCRVRNAPGKCTTRQWEDKWKFHGEQCFYCHVDLSIKTATRDHRKPVTRGGSNWPANLVPACRSCNSKKLNKTEAEFWAYLQIVKTPSARTPLPA